MARVLVGFKWNPETATSAGDFPNVPSRIAERRRARAPRTVHRAIEERHTSLGEFSTALVDVVDSKRELEARTGLRAGHRRRPDQARSLCREEDVDEGLPELEHHRISVLVVNRRMKDIEAEGLHRIEVLGKEGDGVDTVL